MKYGTSQLFELEELDQNLFRSLSHIENYRNTLYGGQVLSQALYACARTVEQRTPHSIHAYFLRPGRSDHPVIYDVEVVRDGGSVSNRRCVARQQGKPIMNLAASFHANETGFRHSENKVLNISPPDEGVRPSDSSTIFIQEFGNQSSTAPVDVVEADLHDDPHQSAFWVRYKPSIKRNEIEQSCALTFASDIGLLTSVVKSHLKQGLESSVFAATIDHALWLHNTEFNINNWLLFVNSSPWADLGRGFATGKIYSPDGELIASTSQEGLIRRN